MRELILHIILPTNPYQVIFRSLSVSEIPGESRNSQSRDADFAHVDSASSFTLTFILHEKIHAGQEELGNKSKDDFIN